MSKTLSIKLIKASITTGPFVIMDQFKNIIDNNVSKEQLKLGVSYVVDDNVMFLTLKSLGKCSAEKTKGIVILNNLEFFNLNFIQSSTACLWRHLENVKNYNYFYNTIEPYIIEYPFAYTYQDQLLQNVKDYTKAYTYLSLGNDTFDYNTRIETNTEWFNEAILYNGQQSSGLLKLVSKPLNNMKEYMSYPKYNSDSKTIMYTKSDNFYQYNTFWSISKNSQLPLFNTTCESLSIDKVVNNSNMDYSLKSFKKATLRAKELKVRHILNNSSTVHLVSQFILTPTQTSYK